MKKFISIFSITLLYLATAFSQGYKVGDKASDFKLKNVDGKFISLSDYPTAKGFVVVFTCNHCPFAQGYQDRIIDIDNKFKSKGFPVIAINSNDPAISSDDSYDKMIVRAKEKNYPFPYLFDETQETYRKYGAKRTPHVYLLEKKGSDLVVRYIGAIDDNFKEPTKVTAPYLSDAITALLSGKEPNPSFTKAIGCSIKDKQYQE